MSYRMTTVQQQVAVGEGLAIGCLDLGVSAVTSSKMAVELAFQRASPGWPRSSAFPSIHASLPRNDFLTIVHKSQNRRGPIVAAWSCERTLTPYLTMDGWTIEDAADLLQESCGVPLRDWTDLARRFVEDLGDGQDRVA